MGISVAIWIEGSGMFAPGTLHLEVVRLADHRVRCPLAGAGSSLDAGVHAVRAPQARHRSAAVLLCLDLTVPMSQTAGRPQEVFTARKRHVSTPHQSPLHLRMLDLLLIGNCRSSRATSVQPDDDIRAGFCGREFRCDGSRDQELVW